MSYSKSFHFNFRVLMPFIKVGTVAASVAPGIDKTSLWNLWIYEVIDPSSFWITDIKWRLDFLCVLEATKWSRKGDLRKAKLSTLPGGRVVYQLGANPEKVVGKNLHNMASLCWKPCARDKTQYVWRNHWIRQRALLSAPWPYSG